MDIILNSGISLILWLQSLGNWLIEPMKFFSFLGNELFYLFAAPVVFWCLDASLGLRMGLGLMVSGAVNSILKLAFHTPRPYWYDLRVQAWSSESSFGIPSGHSQNAVVLWGMLAAFSRRRLAWIGAVALIFLIGLSRMALGVHFPIDVLTGWLFGALLLWALLRFEKPILDRLKRRPVMQQALIALAASLALIITGVLLRSVLGGWTVPASWVELAARAGQAEPIEPLALSGLVSQAATFFGLALGSILLYPRGWLDAGGPFWQRLARFLVGLIGVFIIWYGLDQIFPDGDALIPYLFRYCRYALVGLWIAYLAPIIFIRLGLAQSKYR